MPNNLHHKSYRPTEYNTGIIDDIFECPNLKCGCEITGLRFAEVMNEPYHYGANCPKCSSTWIRDFIQVAPKDA